MSQYRVQLTEDELDGGWIAECLDLPGLMGQGGTEVEALADVRAGLDDWLVAERARRPE